MTCEDFSILTINDPSNYGNRLQNYALQQLLEEYGSTATIDVLLSRKTLFRYAMGRLRKAITPLKWRVFSHLPGERGLIARKNIAGLKFTERFLPKSPYSISAFRGIKGPTEPIHCLVIGSDQVWNYQWINNDALRIRLGEGLHAKLMISYAASFGISAISGAARDIFAKALPAISSISVREDQGEKIVKELSGKDATVVLDPTLMLTANDWNLITQGSVSNDESYILTYFLGRPSREQEHIISRYAQRYNADVRRFLDVRDQKTYTAGPQEFVELFSKAKFVFTDSYHACCFSILFNKQFKVFNRIGFNQKTQMNSRMETLGRLFEIENIFGADEDIPEINYSHVNMLLQQHRQESREWLEKALSN